MTDTDNNSKDYDPMENTRMSLGDHLMELRSRMIKSIIGVLIGFAICLFFGSDILGFITSPVIAALKASGYEPEIQVLSPPEAFITYIKVSLIAGLFVVSPWVFYQIWGFVAAGLYAHEKKFVNTFVPFSAGLFILGGVFFMTVVAPISFNFFITFSSKWQASDFSNNKFYKLILGVDDDNKEKQPPENVPEDEKANQVNRMDPAKNLQCSILILKWITVDISIPVKLLPADPNAPPIEIGTVDSQSQSGESTEKGFISYKFRLKEYVSFVIMLSLAFGLAFQMPIAVYFLGRLGLVSLETFQSVRKYVLLGIVIFSAMITPPDVISQIAMSFPMYILYELGIILLRLRKVND